MRNTAPAPSVALTLALLTAAACDHGGGARAGQLPALEPLQVVGSTPPGGVAGPTAAVTAATAVVRRYYAALDGLRRQMTVAPLLRLMTPDCPCQAQIRAIRAAIRRGDRYTDRIRVLRLVAHVDRPDVIDIVVSLDVRHAGLVDASGRRLRPPTTLRNMHRELLMHHSGDSWLIAQVLSV